MEHDWQYVDVVGDSHSVYECSWCKNSAICCLDADVMETPCDGPESILVEGDDITIVDHPDLPDIMWRHEPPMWKPCYVCGHPTCWVLLDIGFKHPECDMYPDESGDVPVHVRIVLGGPKEVEPWRQGDER